MKKIGLCKGRHDIPEVTEYIFPSEVDPLDIEGLEKTAEGAIKGETHIDLYVTGLTVALGAVVAVCAENDIGLTLYHFNREGNNYYPQEILATPRRCGFCGNALHGWYCSDCGAT